MSDSKNAAKVLSLPEQVLSKQMCGQNDFKAIVCVLDQICAKCKLTFCDI